MDQFHRDLEFRNDVTLNFEILFNDKDKIIAKLKTVENNVEYLKLKQINRNDDEIVEKSNRYSNPEKLLVRYDSLPTPAQCKRCNILEGKLSESLLELRQMKNIVCETEDKCDKLEKIVVEVRKQSAQTKQELADLKEHLRMEKKLRIITNYNGHLIWRMDQFAAKLKDAKENDVQLKSPIFCNQQYGYNLRVRFSTLIHFHFKFLIGIYGFIQFLLAECIARWFRNMERSKHSCLYQCCSR